MLKRLLVMLGILLIASTACAEMMIFEKEVEEIVANDQSREQVEAFALQKAKRLAVEEAGTYISSLSIVVDSVLQKDEITALASGVVQTKIVGVPAIRLVNGVVHVNVKARIQVDTGVLERQVAELLKEKGTLKKLEDEQRKVHDLENRLANLKITELKRLEELNAQAVAMEQERDRRRLVNAEMALKAQGELKKAEIERLQKDRALNERTARMIIDQEQQRGIEASALAQEQDRIRRAQMENEQRWNDLARKSQLAQQQWRVIDDSLSLKQALAEARIIMGEITNLKQRSEFQQTESIATLKAAYAQQVALITPLLPPPLAERDPFESTAEYQVRREEYDKLVGKAIEEQSRKIKALKSEEILKLTETDLEYLQQQVRILAPFAERLNALKERRFGLPDEPVGVNLGLPDADRQCFPVEITNRNKKWTVDWDYSDRNQARDMYSTRTFLKAEALVQLDGKRPEGYLLTAVRVTHPGTNRHRTFTLAESDTFPQITEFRKIRHDAADAETKLRTIREKQQIERASQYALNRQEEMARGAKDGLFVEEAVITDITSRLMWTRDANIAGKRMNWEEATEWVKKLSVGGYNDWRLPTRDELVTIAKRGGDKPPQNLMKVGFLNVKGANYCTSTIYRELGNGYIWIVDMEYRYTNGLPSIAGRSKGFWLGDYIWPVRDIPSAR